MSWRLANSLITLRNQVDAIYPNRSRASDGTIGDSAHAAVKSEHNPNSAGVVTAIDITQDPAHGADMQKLADALIASNDNRIWYIIFNRRIWERGVGWSAYSGTADPHTNHLHLSTNQSASLYDDGRAWNINGKGEQEMTFTEAQDLAFMCGLMAHMTEKEASAPAWRDYHARNIVADPKYAAALLRQLGRGDPWQTANYRYVHYEEDVKKAAGNATILAPGNYRVN